jgi:hypothetical protein
LEDASKSAEKQSSKDEVMKAIAITGGLALSAFLVVAELPHAQEATPQKSPLKGENSFTKAQAEGWLKSAGYTHIADLTLGSDGVWRASARLGDVPALVRLDYQGNVTKH